MGEMTVAELARMVGAFSSERDWEQFHTPRNLAFALVGEVGELAELLQWRTDKQICDWSDTEEGRRALADELADILIYLVRLADVLDVDLSAAAVAKMASNELRYPADEVRGSAEKRP